MVRDVGIALGIELVVVDSVDDPVQLVRLAADHLVEALPELRLLHLGRVALAHRVDHVGVMDSAPEHVDDVVEARDAHVHQPPLLQARERQRAEPVAPLRREVVDGQGRRYVRQRAVGVQAVEHVRDEGGLPVVDVDHVWHEGQRLEHLEHSA